MLIDRSTGHFDQSGTCCICGSNAGFRAHGFPLRSSFICLNCQSPPRARAIIHVWGIHLTGVERRLGQWNVPVPAPTTLGLLGSFRRGSRLMQTAWTTWNGCDGLAALSARPVVIQEDGGLGTAGSCVLDAVAAHQ